MGKLLSDNGYAGNQINHFFSHQFSRMRQYKDIGFELAIIGRCLSHSDTINEPREASKTPEPLQIIMGPH